MGVTTADDIVGTRNVKPIFARLSKDHPRFVSGLGFRMATASWATPRKIAIEAAG
jgi:hypothetical protein